MTQPYSQPIDPRQRTGQPPASPDPRPDANDPPEPYDGMPVSEADYWAYYYEWSDAHYEWYDGRLEEKGVSTYGTLLVFNWFVDLVRQYLKHHGGGSVTNQEFGFSLHLAGGKKSIRLPDTAVILPSNPRQLRHSDRRYDGTFDLCIEALSQSSLAQEQRDTIKKYQEYARVGVPEYYILVDRLEDCRFYRRNRSGRYVSLPVNRRGVICSRHLPGFCWRQRDLLEQPDLDDLADDPLYQPYVQRALTIARQEKEQERVAKEQERAAKEQERTAKEQERAAKEQERAAKEQALALADHERAEKERYRALLQQAGIDPDRTEQAGRA